MHRSDRWISDIGPARLAQPAVTGPRGAGPTDAVFQGCVCPYTWLGDLLQPAYDGSPLARSLLIAHDRVQRDTFSISADDLAKMLGVRRSSIAGVRRAATHRHHPVSPGSITILDRARLEAAACECYGAIQRICQRMLPKRERG